MKSPAVAGAVRVLGVGSPHGDDRAGWEVVARLRREAPPGVEAAVLNQPLRLLEHLDGCSCLILVDACRTGAEPGTVVRLAWPACPPGGMGAGSSTHGVGMAAALGLAEALGRLPTRVVLLGVETGRCDPGASLSPPVRAALPGLYKRVLEEVRWATPRGGSS
jgi:hydrogenase maturation protease